VPSKIRAIVILALVRFSRVCAFARLKLIALSNKQQRSIRVMERTTASLHIHIVSVQTRPVRSSRLPSRCLRRIHSVPRSMDSLRQGIRSFSVGRVTPTPLYAAALTCTLAWRLPATHNNFWPRLPYTGPQISATGIAASFQDSKYATS